MRPRAVILDLPLLDAILHDDDRSGKLVDVRLRLRMPTCEAMASMSLAAAADLVEPLRCCFKQHWSEATPQSEGAR